MRLRLAQVETEALADIRDPVNFVPWLVVGVAVLAALALALAAFWFIRRRARRQAAVPEADPVPPAEWARGEFDRIAASSPQLDDKHFTSAVADVLRAYLERAFEVPAPERTTDEFLALISDHPVFRGRLEETLQAFLRRSDLVKFARQALDETQREPMLREARAVVDEAERERLEAVRRAAETAAATSTPGGRPA